MSHEPSTSPSRPSSASTPPAGFAVAGRDQPTFKADSHLRQNGAGHSTSVHEPNDTLSGEGESIPGGAFLEAVGALGRAVKRYPLPIALGAIALALLVSRRRH